MLIISKFKDYYDGVVNTMGVDKTLVYMRNTSEISPNKYPTVFNSESRFMMLGNHRNYKYKYITRSNCDYFIIGFCGKLYVGWKLSENDLVNITYDFNDVKEYFNVKNFRGNLIDDIEYVTNYDATHLFRELNTPIFAYNYNNYGKDKLSINVNLNKFDFYKIVDCFTAFQEIQMYLGGVLGVGEKETIEVADKFKIAKHGFDKWSFRKEPKIKI